MSLACPAAAARSRAPGARSSCVCCPVGLLPCRFHWHSAARALLASNGDGNVAAGRLFEGEFGDGVVEQHLMRLSLHEEVSSSGPSADPLARACVLSCAFP